MFDTKNLHPTDVHIKVQNFGPIDQAEIDLRPLTVFVGESNTGKTYLAALIYALYSSFAGFSRFPWSHHDVLDLRLTRRGLPAYGKEGEIRAILEKLSKDALPYKFSDLPQRIRVQLQSVLNAPEIFTSQLIRCFDLSSVSDLIRFTDTSDAEMQILLSVREKDQTLWSVEARDSGSGITLEGYVNDDLEICPEEIGVPKETLGILDIASLLRHEIQNGEKTYYLPAARSGLMQSHGVIASALIERATRTGLEGFLEPSTFSGMVADFLQALIRYKERSGSEDQVKGIAKALEDGLLRGQIEVKHPVPGGYPEFLYRPRQTEQTLRMSQVSAMVSELAPLVLFLRGVVCPGDTLIIEEPEAHLHPSAQTQIALSLAQLVRAGVRVVVTTHSEWLLQQIGNLIREGEVMQLGKSNTVPANWLLKGEVGAWWFSGNHKPVAEIPFDRIEGIEPQDYFDIADKLYNTFVKLEQQLLDEEASRAIE